MIFEKDGNITTKTVGEMNKLPDCKYEIVKRKKKRSLDQNKLYRKLLAIRGYKIGYYPDELHDVLKNMFGKSTTTDSDTITFGQYIDCVIHQASMDGVVIQDVEEYKANF